ncbi:hypothetical protein [Aquimarina algiphila]|uniref:hypothetical protein n=1 Tax=Aquimarina algiphila TaxID=2047982 RepID=UPI00232FA20D|nr:hypothetical protein [Aquimarina algiphila]
MTIVQSIFQIDINTKRLIQLFKSGKFKSWDYEELAWRIEQCNIYQFYYLCNEIILDIPINKATIQLFFPFVYQTHFGEYSQNKTPLLTRIDINCDQNTFQNVINHNFFQPEQGIIELLHLEKKINHDLQNLKRELFKKLNFLETIHEIEEETYIQDAYQDSSQELNLNEITGFFGSKESIFKIIVHCLSMPDFLDSHVWEKIEKLSEKAKRLNLNCEEKSLGYQFQIVYPIIFSLDDWKSLIMNKMISCETPLSFNNTKDFFIECLSRYKENTEQTYIYHRYDYYLKEKYKTNLSRSYSEVDKMIKWIENTFISQNKIKANEQFKFVDEINEKLKLIISNDYSQRVFLKLFERYFDSNESNYNYDQLYSMVFHFTKIEKDKLGREAIISKRLKKPVTIQYIDFLTNENTRDFIKVFLLFKKGGIIKTGITDLIEIIIHISKEIKASGISKSNIKKIWAASAEDKKGMEYLLTSNNKFNRLLFHNYPSIKKLFKSDQKKIALKN